MIADPETSFRALHARYCELTGRSPKYVLWMREWRDFAQHFTMDDLEQTLKWVEKVNHTREKRFQIRTELLRLLDPQYFDSLRAEMELERKAMLARKRKLQPTQGQKELASMRLEGRPEPTKPERHVADLPLVELLRKAAQ